jgi:hypothetical protein
MIDQPHRSQELDAAVSHPLARLLMLVAVGALAIVLALIYLPRLDGSSATLPAAAATVGPLGPMPPSVPPPAPAPVITPAPGTIVAPAAERNRTPPRGTWLATQAMATGNLRSLWVFTRVCRRHRACVTDLVRQLPGGGTDEARVSESVNTQGTTVFSATFPAVESVCGSLGRPLPHAGERALMSDEYQIIWMPNRGLRAGVISRGRCPLPFDLTGGLGWIATPVVAAAPRGTAKSRQPQWSRFAVSERADCLGLQKQGQALGAPSQSDLAGWLGRTQAVLSSTLAKLAKLRPPHEQAAAFEEFVASVRSEAELLGRMRLAAAAGRESLLTTLGERLARLGATVAAAAKRAGFECGPTLPDGESESSLPSCEAAGISAEVGNEGACVGPNMNDNGAAITIVADAGHTLAMPGYDLRLLAMQDVPIQVTNASADPTDYPDGRGWRVSFQLSVTNTGSRPLNFDVRGADTQICLSYATRGGESVCFFESLTPNTDPAVPLTDLNPIAPHTTVIGWINFVSASWTPSYLHQRGSDLIVDPVGNTSGDYVGELRLWKWANPAGRAALGLPKTARVPANPPSPSLYSLD